MPSYKQHDIRTLKSCHPLYATWREMIRRCYNPKATAYKHYGARGIRVDGKWFDFWQFVSDMGERPRYHELDRIDNDGHYTKRNCRWADYSTQSANQRRFKR